MKVAFVIQGLTTGGAEKNLIAVANHAAAAGDSVTIITFDRAAESPAFPIDPSIKIVPLGLSTKGVPGAARILRLVSIPGALQGAVANAEAEVVVSFMDQANILTLLAFRGSKIRCVISERINPEFGSLLEKVRSPLRRFAIRLLRNRVYRRAAKLVVQTEGAKLAFPTWVRKLIEVIPNGISAPEQISPEPERETMILAAGRLVKQKRFDLLLEAFALIAGAFPSWTLTIAGEGPLKEELEAHAVRLGLAERVHFAGVTREMGTLYRRAGVFVLCSDYEGFPTVLGEAMAHGAPSISTNCDYGPRELIRSESEGLLVRCGDPDALAAALRALICDPERRASMGLAGRIVSQRFDPEQVLGAWRRVLESALPQPAASAGR